MFKENDKGLDDALACAIKGDPTGKEILLSLNQNDPRVRFNLGWYNIREGELYKGHTNLEYGRMLNVFGGAKKGIPPRYDGSTLKNKTLVFHGEGGFGDEIINIRFAKNFHELGAKVIVGCSKELFPLFDRLPYIHALIDREVCTRSHHDYWVPAMSAIMDLKIEYSALSGDPYLNIFNKRWVPKNSSNFKIGLRWAGNPQFEHQQHRKFPIEKMMELTNIKWATYYSLQRDNDLLDNTPCIDMRYEMKSWKDTAEIISSMDLVISSCTSIAHLSAAMGKETWVISPILPYYIWALPMNTSPWYKDVKLYRQTEYGNWDEPFDQIKKDLINKLSPIGTSRI